MSQYCKKLRSEDIEIGYSIVGRGDPLLLIMGFGGTQDYWGFPFITDLAKRFRVIAFDNRGIGETSSGSSCPSIYRFARDTLNLLKSLHISKTHVLGWSMGSYIAQELAIMEPSIVDHLFLYGSCCDHSMAEAENGHNFKTLFDLDMSDEERTKLALKLLFPRSWLDEKPSFERAFLSRPMTVYSRYRSGIEGQVKAIQSWQGTGDRLGHIDAPTKVIAGELDCLIPCSLSRDLASRLPNGSYVSFKKGGHGLLYQYPQELAQLIISSIKN